MRVPLLGGAYSARSIIANSQKRINYFPEVNTKDAPVPVTHYQRPGLRPLIQANPASPAPVRGLWRPSNGLGGFAVVGDQFYHIDENFGLKSLGNVTANKTNLCSFVDNGKTGLVVDGSQNGWTVDLQSLKYAGVIDPTGTFVGADRIDFIDTFILFNFPGSNQFGCTLSNEIQFDNLFIASKTNWPDPLEAIIVNRHEIVLLGQLKSEIWYDAGNPQFPFAELPGAYIEHGTVAKFSVASSDISVFWLGMDLQGQGVVFRFKGYTTSRISNHALEVQIRKIANSVGLSDAIAYTYQQDGHYFYVLTFPAGDQTWVFDDATNEWHQRAWADPVNGQLHRERPNCHAFINGTNVVGDWENGWLYALDLEKYTDTISGVDSPINCTVSFPHMLSASGPGGQGQLEWDGKRIEYRQFILDMECGTGPQSLDNLPPQITFRYSSDRGRTFGQALLQSAGRSGEYLTQPSWRALGIARDMVFEISHSIAGPAALNGAFVDSERLRD